MINNTVVIIDDHHILKSFHHVNKKKLDQLIKNLVIEIYPNLHLNSL